MEWSNFKVIAPDTRVSLLELKKLDGTSSLYPQNSYNVDLLLELEEKQCYLLTSSVNSPNTFITSVSASFCFSNIRCLSSGGLGLSFSLNYYESTAWLLKRKQKEQVPFFFSLQTINLFSNVRWVLVQKLESISIPSVTGFFPAAI
jgi:hypothetical protein